MLCSGDDIFRMSACGSYQCVLSCSKSHTRNSCLMLVASDQQSFVLPCPILSISLFALQKPCLRFCALIAEGWRIRQNVSQRDRNLSSLIQRLKETATWKFSIYRPGTSLLQIDASSGPVVGAAAPRSGEWQFGIKVAKQCAMMEGRFVHGNPQFQDCQNE